MDKDAGCIREISRRVRLSKSTVSKALHNCGNVDAGTKEAILRAAREVQYDPAGARRAKIQAGETVVGVVLPINPYAFWNEAIRGVKDAIAAQKGVHLSISLYAGMHSEADALYCLDYMEDMRADVLVVTPAPFPAMTERLRDIAARIPVVFFNETADGVPFLFYAGANFYQDGMRLARACRDALASRPDILWIHGAHTPMSRRRDEGFRLEIQALLPALRWTGEVDVSAMTPSLLSAQLARALHERERAFHSVYVSQDILPQVCLALHKLRLDGVTVCGYESPGRNEAYLNRNALAAVIRQDPYRQGYQCIQAVGDWLSQGRLPDNRHLYIASRLRDGAEEEPL